MTTNISVEQIRNIAIVAHVDHGKTTLVDCLFKQSGTFDVRAAPIKRVMDSNVLEQERGITILSKNAAVTWQAPDGENYLINILDTPGHADFGGEVERVLSMADGVLLVVDAVDGPMPQTRFVTQKAFALGLNPVVIINKIDRPSARPNWVIDQVFELFIALGATDKQLDFPIVYTSALQGYATHDPAVPCSDMAPLFETIIKYVPAPKVEVNKPFQMQIISLDYSSYLGAIGIGRIQRGTIATNTPVIVVDAEGKQRSGRVLQVFGYKGPEREEVPSASAGEIIAVCGIENLKISDTLCDPNCVEALPALVVDEPTVSMMFMVNTSPFAGKEGKYVTSRHLKERLERELIHNVALRVEQSDEPDKFKVSGRGELHLSILIENMRREGFELAVSRPEVIMKEVDGELCEPYEMVTIDVEEQHQGTIMERLGLRRGDLKNMISDASGRIRLEYLIPTRALIGFRTEFMTATSGTGLLFSVFDHYGPAKKGKLAARQNGVLISMGTGKTTAFAIFGLQERGRMFLSPQVELYEGMIVGQHNRDNDLVVNASREKQLTNMRASGSDEALTLVPAVRMSLEQALEFIEDDELVEITPQSIRLRKKHLKEVDRKRASK
jgi:GTP-binding protein